MKRSAFKCGRESPTSLLVRNHDEVSYRLIKLWFY